MGKSTASSLLQKRGIHIVDTDVLARQLVEPGQPVLREIRKVFGDEFLDANGILRRDELAQYVFADVKARKKLESILHPRIRECWQAQIGTWRRQEQPLAVVIIPLLFETAAEADFDATVCVACTAGTQHRRLLERGWAPEQIEQRNNAQWPIERKMARADYVVWTEGEMDVQADQLDRIIPAA